MPDNRVYRAGSEYFTHVDSLVTSLYNDNYQECIGGQHVHMLLNRAGKREWIGNVAVIFERKG